MCLNDGWLVLFALLMLMIGIWLGLMLAALIVEKDASDVPE